MPSVVSKTYVYRQKYTITNRKPRFINLTSPKLTFATILISTCDIFRLLKQVSRLQRLQPLTKKLSKGSIKREIQIKIIYIRVGTSFPSFPLIHRNKGNWIVNIDVAFVGIGIKMCLDGL